MVAGVQIAKSALIFVFYLQSIANASGNKSLEITASEPQAKVVICKPPLRTIPFRIPGTPFEGILKVTANSSGLYVCMTKSGDVEGYVRLVVIEKNLNLSIGEDDLEHLRPVNISCSLTLLQTDDFVENVLTIMHGVSKVATKSFFENREIFDMHLEATYPPSYHDGSIFTCLWTVKENLEFISQSKNVKTAFLDRSVFMPVTNVRPSIANVLLGYPIWCLYDGSRTDRVNWYPLEKFIPRFYLEGENGEVLRIMVTGVFEFVCTINENKESRWRGNLTVKARDFNDPRLPLTYKIVMEEERMEMESPHCLSRNEEVYWITEENEFDGDVSFATWSIAGLYGCLVGTDVAALVRLVIVVKNPTLVRTLRSLVDGTHDLTCSIRAWFGTGGGLTNRLELFYLHGATKARNSLKVDPERRQAVDLQVRRRFRSRSENEDDYVRCRWTLVETVGGKMPHREVVESSDVIRIQAFMPPPTNSTTSIGPNTTSTHPGRTVDCRDSKRPNDLCRWFYRGSRGIQKPAMIEFGSRILFYTHGVFDLECICLEKETMTVFHRPWIGKIRVLPVKSLHDDHSKTEKVVVEVILKMEMAQMIRTSVVCMDERMRGMGGNGARKNKNEATTKIPTTPLFHQ